MLTPTHTHTNTQDIVRIDLALENNNFKDQPAFKNAMIRAKTGNGRIHLVGLVR